jgi:hypothetical protein
LHTGYRSTVNTSVKTAFKRGEIAAPPKKGANVMIPATLSRIGIACSKTSSSPEKFTVPPQRVYARKSDNKLVVNVIKWCNIQGVRKKRIAPTAESRGTVETVVSWRSRLERG